MNPGSHSKVCAMRQWRPMGWYISWYSEMSEYPEVTSVAMGFSLRTCLPARRAARTISGCTVIGNVIMTAPIEVEFNRALRSADEPPWSWYKARDDSGTLSNSAATFARVEAEERERE